MLPTALSVLSPPLTLTSPVVRGYLVTCIRHNSHHGSTVVLGVAMSRRSQYRSHPDAYSAHVPRELLLSRSHVTCPRTVPPSQRSQAWQLQRRSTPGLVCVMPQSHAGEFTALTTRDGKLSCAPLSPWKSSGTTPPRICVRYPSEGKTR